MGKGFGKEPDGAGGVKLPFMKDLTNTVVGLAPPALRPMYSIKSEAIGVGHYLPRFLTIRTEVKLYAQFAVREGAPAEEMHHHRMTVIRNLARMLYGPVEMELRDVQRELWEIGVPTDSGPMRRLEALLPALRGEDEDI